jgi:anthranilate phosphoribosyltransferase
MIKETIERLIDGENLTLSEAKELMLKIMEGGVNHSQMAATLIALKCKGETEHELAGFAQAMREKSVRLAAQNNDAVDVCGTGGDGAGTFNISTAAAFIVAGAGVRVAKHGNRAVSSRSGSADVLQRLGINIEMSPGKAAQALEEIGITFMFAPLYHPAMKHVAPVRRELGIKTVFNMLGPLTNPADTKKQLIGTFNKRAAQLMSGAAAHLDMERICFVCTNDQFDEISLSAPTAVTEYTRDSGVKNYEITADDFNFPVVKDGQISGGNPEQNALQLHSLLNKPEPGPAYYVTAANAAMALYISGLSRDLGECARAACESIDSRKAYHKFEQLRELSNGRS